MPEIHHQAVGGIPVLIDDFHLYDDCSRYDSALGARSLKLFLWGTMPLFFLLNFCLTTLGNLL